MLCICCVYISLFFFNPFSKASNKSSVINSGIQPSVSEPKSSSAINSAIQPSVSEPINTIVTASRNDFHIDPCCSSSDKPSETSSNTVAIDVLHADSNVYPHNYDIATYRTKVKTLSREGIVDLINNIYKPDDVFVFPKRNGRSFRIQWLKMFPWLAYSPSADGCFCLPCVLFGDNFKLKNKKNFFPVL